MAIGTAAALTMTIAWAGASAAADRYRPVPPAQFQGANWADPRDNYAADAVVPSGLAVGDDYRTTYRKADGILAAFRTELGAGTVRLPINPASVGTAWWKSYRGAIDAATARGFKVILAYWEDGAASGGRITNIAAWNTMWSNVTYLYGANTNVYFEPMNEPHGYTSTEWRNVAANWLSYHYSAVPSRVLIGGTGRRGHQPVPRHELGGAG